MYKCGQCGKTIEKLPEGAVRCPVCANRILYKARQPVAKEVSAR